MASTKPNDLQDARAREQIKTLTDVGMAVEAAAGAGKTTEMVGRVLALVEGGARMREIAAITFTEKAAAELEARVREKLEELAAKPDATSDQKNRVLTALAELDAASITTIHAFALAIVKERPVEAGVDPSAEIMDEVDDELWFARSWNDWLAQLDDERMQTLRNAVRFGLTLDRVKTLARDLARNRDLAQIFARSLNGDHADSRDAAVAAIHALADNARDLRSECDDQIVDANDKGYQNLVGWSGALAALIEAESDWDLLAAVFALNPTKAIPLRGGAKKNYRDPDFNQERQARMKAARAQLEAVQDAIGAVVMDDALGLLAGFVEADWKARQLAGLINFQDVLILARDVLAHPEAGRHYRERMRWLLIDEFQDTDPLQVQIVDLLVGDDQNGLFLVGDPKQSIYRFRRADVSVYRRRVERLLAAVGRERTLLFTNFRSVPGVIDWVNREFEKIIVERGSLQADYVPMSAFREPLPEAPPPVSALMPWREEALTEKVDPMRADEANHVAALIECLVGSGRYQVLDKDEGGLVPLGYRHVAVLFFTRPGKAEDWLAPFVARGIPFVSDMSRRFFSRDEVSALRLALRAIEDPYDSFALFGALKSPLFGFSDEDLFLFRARGNRLTYMDDPGGVAPEFDEAFAVLRELHAERNRRPIVGTIEELLAPTGLRIGSLISSGDDSGVTNLERFLSLARSYQETPGADFSRFVDYLAEVVDLELDSREPITLDPGEDFVRFSTVHGAKGLEFPVVIVANMSAGAKRGPGAILVERTDEPTAAACSGRFASTGYDRLAAEEEQALFEESKRLLYVAATRARDALVLSVFPPYGPDQLPADDPADIKKARFVDLLPGYLKTWDPAKFGTTVEGVHFWDHDELPLEVDEAAAAGRAGRPDEHDDALTFQRERDRVLAAASTGVRVRTASERDRDHGVDPLGDEVESREARPAGLGQAALIGSLVHELMESADLAAGEVPRGVIEASARAAGLDDVVDELARLTANCLASAPIGRAVAAGAWHTEVPYSVWMGDELHEGKIDLLFREGERYVVVDYKTDRVSASAVSDKLSKYRGQGEAYRRAIMESTGSAAVEVWFVFAGPGVDRELVT